jgi:hypothetical protein
MKVVNRGYQEALEAIGKILRRSLKDTSGVGRTDPVHSGQVQTAADRPERKAEA